ncbi:porin family protein [Sediminitomix flava]|uniref:Outer membrane protein with beta-barrel domain n=1 Tax=Sediminitomix flava TaxID=379075 RepID=A0A315Z8Z0_SEDFL|nr:porin family protein [Sediminitomix flava]PWJ41025.1 outer membrane protein with beta-barrel domain [Sediminitomix flava]
MNSKKIILSIFFSFFTLFAFAQEFQIGISQGFNTLRTSQQGQNINSTSVNGKKGMGTSLVAEMYLSEHVGFSTGFIFENRSYAIDDGVVFQSEVDNLNPYLIPATHDLFYKTVPILIKFRSKGDKGKFYIEGGSYVSWLQGSSVQDVSYDFGSVLENENLFNDFDMGFSFGTGVDLYIVENIILGFNARLNLGLVDMNAKEWPEDVFKEESLKNNTLQFSASLKYVLGKG